MVISQPVRPQGCAAGPWQLGGTPLFSAVSRLSPQNYCLKEKENSQIAAKQWGMSLPSFLKSSLVKAAHLPANPVCFGVLLAAQAVCCFGGGFASLEVPAYGRSPPGRLVPML